MEEHVQMKITEQELKEIIKEEINEILGFGKGPLGKLEDDLKALSHHWLSGPKERRRKSSIEWLRTPAGEKALELEKARIEAVKSNSEYEGFDKPKGIVPSPPRNSILGSFLKRAGLKTMIQPQRAGLAQATTYRNGDEWLKLQNIEQQRTKRTKK